MQDRPDRVELLGAIARFLGEQLLPNVPDRALVFRTRIAAWLLEVVTRELTLGEGHDLAELSGLQILLEEPLTAQPTLHAERTDVIAELRARLSAELRVAEISDERFADIAVCLKQTLADKVSVVQPRFDLSPDPETQ